MKTIYNGLPLSFKFHYANSSFDKVVEATKLFEHGKSFVLYTADKDDFLVYIPQALISTDRHSATKFYSLNEMSIQLGIDLMCFDCVQEIREDLSLYVNEIKTLQ